MALSCPDDQLQGKRDSIYFLSHLDQQHIVTPLDLTRLTHPFETRSWSKGKKDKISLDNEQTSWGLRTILKSFSYYNCVKRNAASFEPL